MFLPNLPRSSSRLTMSSDNVDPVVHWLKLGLGTVLPLAVVAVSLVISLLPPRGERVVLGDILCTCELVVRDYYMIIDAPS